MANKIKIKNSNVKGKIPTPADLDVAELAINLADQKIYTKEPGGTIIPVSIVLPTDSAGALMNDASGKLSWLPASSTPNDTTPYTGDATLQFAMYEDSSSMNAVIEAKGTVTDPKKLILVVTNTTGATPPIKVKIQLNAGDTAAQVLAKVVTAAQDSSMAIAFYFDSSTTGGGTIPATLKITGAEVKAGFLTNPQLIKLEGLLPDLPSIANNLVQLQSSGLIDKNLLDGLPDMYLGKPLQPRIFSETKLFELVGNYQNKLFAFQTTDTGNKRTILEIEENFTKNTQPVLVEDSFFRDPIHNRLTNPKIIIKKFRDADWAAANVGATTNDKQVPVPSALRLKLKNSTQLDSKNLLIGFSEISTSDSIDLNTDHFPFTQIHKDGIAVFADLDNDATELSATEKSQQLNLQVYHWNKNQTGSTPNFLGGIGLRPNTLERLDGSIEADCINLYGTDNTTGGTANSGETILRIGAEDYSKRVASQNRTYDTLFEVKRNGEINIKSLAGSGTQMVVVDTTGKLQTQPIPSGGGITPGPYADNTAASAAGLTAGQQYYTATGDVKVVI
jgi:hypothetical protein